MSRWVLKGRCRKFGDDVPLDGGLIPFRLAMARVMEPEKLIPHLFEEIVPEFHKRVAPGDIIVAGRRFACGKPHVQGFIALRALGLGVVCESMPFNALRGAVSRGTTLMPGCAGVTSLAEEDDQLEVNFETGRFRNETRGIEQAFRPLDPSLLEMIAKGGSEGLIREWVARKTLSA
jgi:3-isopropylmalate/(R)-2-methylmalate dehydratase small subunit